MNQVLPFLLALSVSSLHGQQHTIDGELCTSTQFTFGYDYNIWYNASEISTMDGTVMLKFYVVTKSDAYIILAGEAESPGPGYEIVLGDGLNTFSEIIRFEGYSEQEAKATVNTKEILDVENPVGFWVYASEKSGLIMVGRSGEILPFIFWRDPEPIPVNYYSFSSRDDVIGKWMFKCKPDPQSNTTVSNKTDLINICLELKNILT